MPANNNTANNTVTIRLVASIAQDNRLVLTFSDGHNEVPWVSGRGIEQLANLARTGQTLTLEVDDFLHRDSLYHVFGGVLPPERNTVEAYWEATGCGQRYVLDPISPPRLLIGAEPRLPGAPVPVPFVSWPSAYLNPQNPTDPIGERPKIEHVVRIGTGS